MAQAGCVLPGMSQLLLHLRHQSRFGDFLTVTTSTTDSNSRKSKQVLKAKRAEFLEGNAARLRKGRA